jgi:hypothetical protein
MLRLTCSIIRPKNKCQNTVPQVSFWAIACFFEMTGLDIEGMEGWKEERAALMPLLGQFEMPTITAARNLGELLKSLYAVPHR